MRLTVQARLDRESQQTLERLVRQLGLSPSEVIREGLRLLSVCQGRTARQKIIGVGKFASGIKDLGSNKAHLEGFGR